MIVGSTWQSMFTPSIIQGEGSQLGKTEYGHGGT